MRGARWPGGLKMMEEREYLDEISGYLLFARNE